MPKHIHAPELKLKLDKNEALILIDCREQEEWDSGHISKARFMALSNFEAEVEKAEASGLLEKGMQIIMQCRSGKRSMTACGVLKKRGYTDLTNLDGGILEWIEHNYPVEE